MAKKVAILQSSYIPWKGYFDIVGLVDEFILYDDVQFTKRDWRNRNRIKTINGSAWLTIPVETKGKYLQLIKDTKVDGQAWREEHWKAISINYARAPYFGEHKQTFEAIYMDKTKKLSTINFQFIEAICRILGIHTKLSWSMDYEITGDRTARLVSLCQQAGASAYLSGPSARDYIEPQAFKQAGIGLSYIDYSGYPEYNQLYPPFEHQVSVIDLIFNEGPNAPTYMKSLG